MMSTAEIPAGLRAQYQRERTRSGGMPEAALYALAAAKRRGKDASDYGWTGGDGYARPMTAERDGFTLQASYDYDQMLGFEDYGYGTFSDERNGDRWAVPMYRSSQGISATTGDHANTWYHPVDPEDWRAYMSKRGASRSVAEEYTRQRAEREARDAAEASEYVLTVKAFRAGVELGSATIGGYGFDPDDWDHERQVAEGIEENGLADEAITEARQTLATLREEEA